MWHLSRYGELGEVMPVVNDLISMYKGDGFRVTGGFSPHHFGGITPLNIPFMYLYRDDKLFSNGAGMAISEIALLEEFCHVIRPKSIFIIGNAFGWSALALALINPDACVISMDGCFDLAGEFGLDLTNKLAGIHGMDNVSAIKGVSPVDVGRIISEYIGADGVDLFLIDGEHTNDAQRRDFEACYAASKASSVFLFHDVINYGMVSGFKDIVASKSMIGKILHRTPSGMAVCTRESHYPNIEDVVDAFSCEERDIAPLQYKARWTQEMQPFLLFED